MDSREPRHRNMVPGFSVGVVGHHNRAEQARRLAELVGACVVSIDDGTLGCTANHRVVWQHLAAHSDSMWSITIEDDALPVPGFRDQLTAALAVAPTPVVSLYLGRGRPPKWQQRIAQAIAAADEQQAHWIVGDGLLHGVGVAIKTRLVPAMLDSVKDSTQPIDFAVRDWARRGHHRIGFTWPSILQHRDEATLIRHPDGAPRTEPRRAWRVGARDLWTSKAVHL